MSISEDKELEQHEIDRIIGMAWEDRTPFDAIEHQFGLSEDKVIKLMRSQLKRKSWERWRKRVSGRDTKHRKKRSEDVKAICLPCPESNHI